MEHYCSPKKEHWGQGYLREPLYSLRHLFLFAGAWCCSLNNSLELTKSQMCLFMLYRILNTLHLSGLWKVTKIHGKENNKSLLFEWNGEANSSLSWGLRKECSTAFMAPWKYAVFLRFCAQRTTDTVFGLVDTSNKMHNVFVFDCEYLKYCMTVIHQIMSQL